MSNSAISPILLIESNSLAGGIIISAGRDLNMVTLRHVPSVRSARLLLKVNSFSGFMIGLDEKGEGLSFIEELRSGRLECAADLPIVVITKALDAATAQHFKSLSVRRVLVVPFKVRDVMTSLIALIGDRRNEGQAHVDSIP